MKLGSVRYSQAEGGRRKGEEGEMGAILFIHNPLPIEDFWDCPPPLTRCVFWWLDCIGRKLG